MTDGTSAVAAGEPIRPYAPSWSNSLTRWFERLPGPTWVAYVVAMAFGVVVSLSQSFGSNLPEGVLLASAVYYGSLPFAVLGLIHSLDHTAGHALARLRGLLEMDDAEVAAYRYQFTVAPARPAAILTIAAIVLTPIGYILDPVGSGVSGLAPAALAARFAWEALVSAIFLILLYHTIRQLRLIPEIHARIGRVDVFDQGSLYAMSRVTSRTAAGLVLLTAPSVFLISPAADVATIVLSGIWYGVAVGLATAAFVLPLRGIHDRLVEEKRRLQSEVGRRLTSTLDAIHAAVDAGDGPTVDARNKALATLIAERDLVNRIPTWPWSTGALTGFLSAVLLPIVLFLMQRLLVAFLTV